ncbi:hypothetical protein ADL00_45435 [Streptomyces sp. AS58]|uniref:hypothetical protein n=1 Tax=Streptomyces sp. AS58 TaxID=1519489 RepID=UPI0006AF48DB|nr:hypothetical protein [Streptomyces sp. AS58]KOV49782.1 hypothetical protein ADL00_45435 [Streptomyces sp. AS58]
MSGHPLIDDYLARLSRCLPADVVDELADGLAETYRRHLGISNDSRTAARAAIAEFGGITEVVTAFTLQSPGCRTARTLLATGPVAAASWAVALITGRAWAWPIAVPARLALGVLLCAVVAALFTAAVGCTNYARTRTAVITGGIGLVVLDVAVLVGAALAAPAVTWPLALAAMISLARIGFTLRALPGVIAA